MYRPIRGQRRAGRRALAVAAAALAAVAVGCGSDDSSSSSSSGGGTASGDTIPVGILHSLSGTMAISEVSVRDAELLAINEINKAGGVLGKQLEPVVEDGASDWPTFAEKAQKLISTDKVAATFGGWTSASRKAMLPVFERNKALLYYPVQYEGLEASPYIFYTGRHDEPADHPRPRVPAGEAEGQDALPRRLGLRLPAHGQQGDQGLGEGQRHDDRRRGVRAARQHRVRDDDQQDQAGQARRRLPDDQRRLERRLLEAVQGLRAGRQEAAGDLRLDGRGRGPRRRASRTSSASTSPGTTTRRPLARRTRSSSRRTRRRTAPTASQTTRSRPATSACTCGRWRPRRPARTDVEKVKAASKGLVFEAPEGKVTVDGENQHIYKTARIGQLRPDGLIDTVFESDGPIKPDPYLKSYTWAKGL